jgi:hypothetical protein
MAAIICQAAQVAVPVKGIPQLATVILQQYLHHKDFQVGLKVVVLDHIMHQVAAAEPVAVVVTELLGKVDKVAAEPIMQYFLAILVPADLADSKVIIAIHH